MAATFHREYLVQLPLPLAQLYSRASNAKDPRGRYENAYYLFEALIKLTAAPLIAAYLQEVRHGGTHVEALDRQLTQLALPSLGQWVGMVREVARSFGERADASSHPLGHLWPQLTRQHRDQPGLLELYRRIKNGPDGRRTDDRACSVLQVFEALVQYRNGIFHGGPRFAAFYERDMGPLLSPAVNELLAPEVFSPLGPPGTHLVYLTGLQVLAEERYELRMDELVGFQGAPLAPLELTPAQAVGLAPHQVAVLWPGHRLPLRLDPLLRYRENELVAEVLFLNGDRKTRRVEYLSYTTGETSRDETMAPAMARLLSLITAQPVTEGGLSQLEAESLAVTPTAETSWEAPPEPLHQLGEYELLAEIGRGGMGIVYLARQLSLGRLVALKILPDDLAHDATALARFQREMRALAQCEHPNIMKVLTNGTLPDGRLYYTMEYVPGANLEQVWQELAGHVGQDPTAQLTNATFRQAVLSASSKQRQDTEARYRSGMRSGTLGAAGPAPHARPEAAGGASADDVPVPRLPLPPLPALPSAEEDPRGYVRRIVTLMRDAALAVQAVHDQQIIHRDVKPANLMLTPDGARVVLMDFGLAKGAEPTLMASRQGGLLGTLRYAAPEQLAAANLRVGPAADVRGLGVTL
jgi:Protein tyrosine and serine/threonine kinase